MDTRDTLFADLPLSLWIPCGHPLAASSPGREFVQAEEAMLAGNPERASELLLAVTRTAGLDSRHYLVAWRALRALRIEPAPALAREVHAVVLEVSFEHGLDLLAAYRNRAARYYNYRGAGIVWEPVDSRLDHAIDTLLAAGAPVAQANARWNKPRPPPPEPGMARINVLTPAGLHFEQGEVAALERAALTAPAMQAGLALMQKLVAQIQRPS